MGESDEILNNYIKDSNTCNPDTPEDIEQIKNALLQLAKIKTKNKKCRETLRNKDAALTQALTELDKKLIDEFIGDAASIKASRVAGDPGSDEGKSKTGTSDSETDGEKGKVLLDPARQARHEDHLANIKATVTNNTVKAFLLALMDLPRKSFFDGEIRPDFIKEEFKKKFVENFKLLEPKKKIDAEQLMTNLIHYMLSKYSVISNSATFDELIYNLCSESSEGGFWQLVQNETLNGNSSKLENSVNNRKLLYYLVTTDWLFGDKSNFNEAVKSIVDLSGVDLAGELTEDIKNKILNIYDFLHFSRPVVGEDGRSSFQDLKFFENGLTMIFQGTANSPGEGNTKKWFTFLSEKTSFIDWINKNFKGKNAQDGGVKKMMYSLAYAAEYHKYNEQNNTNLQPADMKAKNTEMIQATKKVIEDILNIPRDKLFPFLIDIDGTELENRKQIAKDIIGGETIEKTITIEKKTSEQILGLNLIPNVYSKKIPAKINKIYKPSEINKDFREGDYIITVDGRFLNNIHADWPARPDNPYKVLIVRKKTDDDKGDDKEVKDEGKPDPFDEVDKILTAENKLSEFIPKFNEFKAKTDEPDYAEKLKKYQKRLQELLKEEVDNIINMPESVITNAEKTKRLTKFKDEYKAYLKEVSEDLNKQIDEKLKEIGGDGGPTPKPQSNNLTLVIIEEGDIETYKKTEKAKLTNPDEYTEVEINVTSLDDLKFNLDISGGKPALFTSITGSDSLQKDDYILLIKIVNKEDTTTTKKISQVDNKEIDLNIKDLYQTEDKPKEIKITVLRKNSATAPPPPSSPATASSEEKVDIKDFNGALIRVIDTTTAKFGRQSKPRNPFIYNEKKKQYFRPDPKYIGETKDLDSQLNEPYQLKTIEIPESKNQGKKDDFKIRDLKFQIETRLTDPNSTIFKAITDKTKNPAIIELLGLIK